MSSIKINRALKASRVGRFPGSADAMLERIPASVVAHLTGAALAEMADAMWDACQESKIIAASDACNEGAVWDVRRGRLRELAP
jgi:hypothetical protein